MTFRKPKLAAPGDVAPPPPRIVVELGFPCCQAPVGKIRSTGPIVRCCAPVNEGQQLCAEHYKKAYAAFIPPPPPKTSVSPPP
jgi:hypothetical protein